MAINRRFHFVTIKHSIQLRDHTTDPGNGKLKEQGLNRFLTLKTNIKSLNMEGLHKGYFSADFLVKCLIKSFR